MSGPVANRFLIGDVAITSVVELEGQIPGELMIPSAGAHAVLAHPWLVPDFATEDGMVLLRIQLLVVESQGQRIAIDTCLGNDKPRTNELMANLQTPFFPISKRPASRASPSTPWSARICTWTTLGGTRCWWTANGYRPSPMRAT